MSSVEAAGREPIGLYEIGTWKVYRDRDHASVILPGVLQTNVGHSNFRYVCNFMSLIKSYHLT